MLFCPVHQFIGDIQKLQTAQKEILRTMNTEDWNFAIGNKLIPMLGDTNKMAVRFGLTQQERQKLKKQIILVQCPLSLEKMREYCY
jgi:hypothetical protein